METLQLLCHGILTAKLFYSFDFLPHKYFEIKKLSKNRALRFRKFPLALMGEKVRIPAASTEPPQSRSHLLACLT